MAGEEGLGLLVRDHLETRQFAQPLWLLAQVGEFMSFIKPPIPWEGSREIFLPIMTHGFQPCLHITATWAGSLFLSPCAWNHYLSVFRVQPRDHNFYKFHKWVWSTVGTTTLEFQNQKQRTHTLWPVKFSIMLSLDGNMQCGQVFKTGDKAWRAEAICSAWQLVRAG